MVVPRSSIIDRMLVREFFKPWLCLVIAAFICAGCRGTPSRSLLDHNRVELLREQTVSDIGAAQGLFLHDGFIYLFGDAETGVIREFALEFNPLRLQPTGRIIRLTINGIDACPHPTGLTHHPEYGTWLSDTVRQRGTLMRIDWERALRDGNLDSAMLHSLPDDIARNGSRLEFARYQGRWVLATADYGDATPELRLYDPQTLASATATSDAGVLIRRWPAGQFTQSLRWLDDTRELVFVQNRTPGRLYRLVFASLDCNAQDMRAFPAVDLAEPLDELEGFAMINHDTAILVSAMPEDNVRFVRLLRRPSESSP